MRPAEIIIISTMAKIGPRTIYGPKDLPGRSHSLTKLAKDILDAAAERCNVSESNIVEHLARRFAGQLTPEEFAPLDESNGDAQAA